MRFPLPEHFPIRRYFVFFAALQILWSSVGMCEATVVRFASVLGPIDVRLYNTATPLTTANFLNYSNDGDYVDSFIHRSVPGFVVQGGGFTFPSNEVGVEEIPTDPPVPNEPGISNLRGTIAMAKLGGDPDSATSQWFFNLGDNSENLDSQNGGFTVFGRVVGDGMTVVDAIASLQTVPAGGPFDQLPVRDLEGQTVLKENLVTFDSIAPLELPDGDYNFDGTVDDADLAIWKNDFGSSTKAEADGNGNGVVDGADFLVWQRNVGATAAQTSNLNVVPEPGSIWLLCLGILAYFGRACLRAGE